MPSRILKRMRDSVRSRDYVMTLHADDEMNDDDLTVFDVESVILTGEIIRRERDPKTKERKYVVRGQIVLGDEDAVVVTKFGPAGKLVIITVYVE
ncbi:MAG TPA: DUF4258 domain-containing protein [Blastocatellia bacterium]